MPAGTGPERYPLPLGSSCAILCNGRGIPANDRDQRGKGLDQRTRPDA
jgi:hypothetical protein